MELLAAVLIVLMELTEMAEGTMMVLPTALVQMGVLSPSRSLAVEAELCVRTVALELHMAKGIWITAPREDWRFAETFAPTTDERGGDPRTTGRRPWSGRWRFAEKVTAAVSGGISPPHF